MLVGDYLLVVAWVVEDAAVCRITSANFIEVLGAW